MRKGFTLVEVLVVTALVGLLAASLLWGFASARRQGQYSQAQAHGLEVFLAIDAFLVRNTDLLLDLDGWTAAWPVGSLEGAPPALAGLNGFDCRQAVTLGRGGMEGGGQSWGAAPATVGCLIERVGDRFLVHTWVRGLPRHYLNGRDPP